jgi:hypothetical protein
MSVPDLPTQVHRLLFDRRPLHPRRLHQPDPGGLPRAAPAAHLRPAHRPAARHRGQLREHPHRRLLQRRLAHQVHRHRRAVQQQVGPEHRSDVVVPGQVLVRPVLHLPATLPDPTMGPGSARTSVLRRQTKRTLGSMAASIADHVPKSSATFSKIPTFSVLLNFLAHFLTLLCSGRS